MKSHKPQAISRKLGVLAAMWVMGTVGILSGQTPVAPPPVIGNPSQPVSAPTIGNPSQPATAVSTEDIHDIRGVQHIPYAWLWIVWLVGLLLALALIIPMARRWKNRPRTPVKTLDELALEQLDASLALIEAGKAREFSIVVSGVVREYIERRFQAKAARRTTEEFLHQLLFDVMSPLAPYSESLGDFLKHCDLAKFAKWTLSADDMRAMHASARNFVIETKPRPGVPPAPNLPPKRATPPAVPPKLASSSPA